MDYECARVAQLNSFLPEGLPQQFAAERGRGFPEARKIFNSRFRADGTRGLLSAGDLSYAIRQLEVCDDAVEVDDAGSGIGVQERVDAFLLLWDFFVHDVDRYNYGTRSRVVTFLANILARIFDRDCAGSWENSLKGFRVPGSDGGVH